MENHRSIRKYKTKLIDEKIIERALNKAIRASSSGNMQTYSIIVTKSIEMREKLRIAHFDQKMVTDAPVFVTFCADNYRHTKWSEESGIEKFSNFDNLLGFMIASIDAILVSQNAALAFEQEGLGICYLGSVLANCDQVSDILELPDGVIPVVGFTLGYPNENPPLRDRLPLKYLVHSEKYKKMTKSEILDCYEYKEINGMKRYKEVKEFAAMIEKHDIKGMAEVYAKLKYSKEDYEDFSANIYESLKKGNYLNFKK